MWNKCRFFFIKYHQKLNLMFANNFSRMVETLGVGIRFECMSS